MSDIFEEVSDDVRTDRYQKVGKKYGYWFIGAAGAVIVLTAAYQGWKAYETAKNEAEAVRFVAAMQQVAAGNPGPAVTAFEAIQKSSTPGYATLARLQKAAALFKAGDRRESVATYDEISADTKLDRTMRDYAALLAAEALVDTTDMATMERRLTPLLGNDNPWRYSARELLALAALKRADLDRARKEFAVLTDDPNTPQGVRARAAEVLAAIGGGA